METKFVNLATFKGDKKKNIEPLVVIAGTFIGFAEDLYLGGHKEFAFFKGVDEATKDLCMYKICNNNVNETIKRIGLKEGDPIEVRYGGSYLVKKYSKNVDYLDINGTLTKPVLESSFVTAGSAYAAGHINVKDVVLEGEFDGVTENKFFKNDDGTYPEQVSIKKKGGKVISFTSVDAVQAVKGLNIEAGDMVQLEVHGVNEEDKKSYLTLKKVKQTPVL